MTKEQAEKIIELLSKLVEQNEGMAIEFGFFVQQYRENQSFPRSVRVAGGRA